MDTPLVSICCLTYNHARFIRQCLDSFLMQKTDFPIEIIINDDSSNDGTTEIIREYEQKYPDLIYPIYHEKNLYSTGFRGPFQKLMFPKARGKYIAICEGDDYWTDPCKLQKQVDCLESHPDCSLCCHPVQFINMDGVEPFGYFMNKLPHGYFTFDEFNIPTCSIMFRSSIAPKIPIHPGFEVVDTVITKTCSLFGPFFCLDGEMGAYRRHKDSWSNQDLLVMRRRTLKHLFLERDIFRDDKRIVDFTDGQIIRTFSAMRRNSQWGYAKSAIEAFKIFPLKFWFTFLRRKFLS